MPIYRCNRCGHIEESSQSGIKVPCASCGTPSQVFDTPFYVGKLIERYAAAVREIKALQAEEREAEVGADEVSEANSMATTDEAVGTALNTSAQHAPLVAWFRARQIQAQFDHDNVDTSGYFDEAAIQLGQGYEQYGELIRRVTFAYRKSHTGLNLDLSRLSQKEAQEINALCRQLYSHTFFSRYHYQKVEKNVRLTLQTAPRIRQFFEGGWLEWYALMELVGVLQQRGLGFSCARSARLSFPNEDLHELDVIALPTGQSPVCIECKAGEFRRDIEKYQRLRKRLGIDRQRFIVCSTELDDEQAKGLSAMYELSFVAMPSLARHLHTLF